jgi:hypothetical protein
VRRAGVPILLLCVLMLFGCGGHRAPAVPAGKPAGLDPSRLSLDERKVLARVDALAMSRDASGAYRAGQVLAAVDLQPFVHSVATNGVTGSTAATKSLKDFDRVFASSGATATYAAMVSAYGEVAHRGEKASPMSHSLANVEQAVISTVVVFVDRRAFTLNPEAVATLTGLRVSGDAATLIYRGNRTGGRVTVTLALARHPDGSIRIAGVRDMVLPGQ